MHLQFTTLQLCLRHGEAETRIQSQMFGSHTALSDNADLYIQDANDSDYITLAAMSHAMGAIPSNSSVIVMSQGRHTKVTSLVTALRDNDCDVIDVCRLYCITGNDFNNGSTVAVATCERMVQTYAKLRSQLGLLSEPKDVSQLYYWSFLDVIYGGTRNIRGLQGSRVMSTEWKRTVRELVATSARTRMSNQLLPQDADLELVYRRAILFNIELYWGQCLETNLHNIPCSEQQGFKDDGQFLLLTEQSLTERQRLLRLLNASCGCGKTITDDRSCCTTKRCSSVSASKYCDERCKCKLLNCTNTTMDRTTPTSGESDHHIESPLTAQTQNEEEDYREEQGGDTVIEIENEKESDSSELASNSSVIDLTGFNDVEFVDNEDDSSSSELEDAEEHNE